MWLSLLLLVLVDDPPGKVVFEAHCAMCHVESSATPMRAPHIPDLRQRRPEEIREALMFGAMSEVGMGLSDKEIDDVATWLTGKAPSPPSPSPG